MRQPSISVLPSWNVGQPAMTIVPFVLTFLDIRMLPPIGYFDDVPKMKRDDPPPTSSAESVICQGGTETYIKLTPKASDFHGQLDSKENQEQISQLVGNAWTYITREYLGDRDLDGVIKKAEGWVFERTSSHATFKLQIANSYERKKTYVPNVHGWLSSKLVGHEITWGVLRAALTALGTHMDIEKLWTPCSFEVWDGPNQVGIGRIVVYDES
ncbi:MAG: hypothetical protein Q9222_004942 [Ikaeria aurantiellina]